MDIYTCYLNGKIYGTGPLEFMNELFRDYVVTCKLYNKEEVTFTIQKGKPSQ